MSERIKTELQTVLSTTWPHAEISNLRAELTRLTQSLADRERRIERLTDALREAKHRFTNIQRSGNPRGIAQIGEAELEDVLSSIPTEGEGEVRAARGEWQPIETAPRDTPVLAANSEVPSAIDVVEWVEWGKDSGWFNGEWRAPPHYFTHWQPLPAPPLSRAQHGPSQNPDQEKTE